MIGVVSILALVALFLAVVSLFPPAEKWPLLAVAVLLLAVALFLWWAGPLDSRESGVVDCSRGK